MSLACVPFSTQAGVIGTDQVVTQAQAQADRDRIRQLVARADVQKALQSYGVSEQAAQERVDALTDAEIQQIAGNLDSLPTGANAIATVAIVIAVIVLIYIILQHVYPKN
jgi:hypothetical protein